ncbi:MAG: hypothetical protein QOH95_596, partial [Gaiellaceae bacterium]|nr:hypothetical protein [Gaiellaceae bacterium]
MTASGIYGDGWVQQRSRFALPPGDAGALTIRADVLPEPQQRLEVILDGRVVSSERIDGGAMDLRIPVEASTAARSVELRWAVARPLAEDDPREASALLRFLDITPARAPATLRVPA